MTESEWNAATSPEPMLEFLRGRASERKLRLFAVACCRRVWDGLKDSRSRNAVEVAEWFADGDASEEEMRVAHDAAYSAVDDCLGFSPFSEDQAIAAYLVAAIHVDEVLERYDPFPGDAALHGVGYAIDGLLEDCEPKQAALLRDIFGNAFVSPQFDPSWRTSTVLAIATQAYDTRDFAIMPILADALSEAGVPDGSDLIRHLRGPGPHCRGCFALDLILGKT